MSRWLVGIDAGGSSCRVLAVDLQSGELRLERGGQANWTVDGGSACAATFGELVARSVPDPMEISGVTACISGYYPPDHEAEAQQRLGTLWPGAAVRVDTDVLAAWAGAHSGETGIVVISGTGSIALGCRDQRQARAGGWGPLFDDRGSAYRVGIEVLQAVADEWDAVGPSTLLTQAVQNMWGDGYPDSRGWLRAYNRAFPGREITAKFARAAVESAAHGDPVARSILDRSVWHLAELARVVARGLDLSECPVSLVGGFGSRPEVQARFSDVLGEGLRLVSPEWPPVVGAVLLAAPGPTERAALLQIPDLRNLTP